MKNPSALVLIEVKVQRSFVSSSTSGTYRRPEICAYFVPYLSAVQLFGQSSFSTSPNHGGLLFEYFEWEKPFSRPPLFTKYVDPLLLFALCLHIFYNLFYAYIDGGRNTVFESFPSLLIDVAAM
jgi:hypothetical protein